MLLGHPFRIFFFGASIYAILIVFAWLAFLFEGWPLPLGWAPMQWHSHEMIYGFVSAPIAGFILTAITNWTSAQPLNKKALLGLFLLWTSGRAVMWFSAWLSPWLIAVVDLAFIFILAIYVLSVLLKYRNYRNLVLVAVLSFLFGGNLMMHLGFITGKMQLLLQGQFLGLDLITLLIAVIAGRIIPAFSRNWLKAKNKNVDSVRTWPALELPCLLTLAFVAIINLLFPASSYTGVLILMTAILHSFRLYSWSGWVTVREPLLWILHLAYLWLVVALYLRGLSYFTDDLPVSVWQHALGVGAIGTIILGVMTRVTMGHTGNKLYLIPGGIIIYLSITIAALARVLAALGVLDFRLGVTFSAVAFAVAFMCFAVLYGPILMSPRVDGKPG